MTRTIEHVIVVTMLLSIMFQISTMVRHFSSDSIIFSVAVVGSASAVFNIVCVIRTWIRRKNEIKGDNNARKGFVSEDR